MTRVWARELAENATVNSVNPGAVATGQYLVAPDDIKENIARWNPLTPLALRGRILTYQRSWSMVLGSEDGQRIPVRLLVSLRLFAIPNLAGVLGALFLPMAGSHLAFDQSIKNIFHCPKTCQDEGFKYILSTVLVTSEYVYLT